MKVWGSWAESNWPVQNGTAAEDDPTQLAGLMKHADGTGQGWARFLLSIFDIEGVAWAIYADVNLSTTPKYPAGDWTPAGWTYSSSNPNSIIESKKLQSQGNTTPSNLEFNSTAIVFFKEEGTKTDIFDPSFGLEAGGATFGWAERQYELNMAQDYYYGYWDSNGGKQQKGPYPAPTALVGPTNWMLHFTI